MANLTTSITARGANNHHNFELTITEVGKSIENNTSDIYFKFRIYNGGYWDWNSWGERIKYTLQIGDNTYTGYIPRYDVNDDRTLKEGTIYSLKHNNDGSKTLNFSFKVEDTTGQGYTCGDADASGSLALTQLHKAPLITNCVITEENASLKTLGVRDEEIVPYMSKKKFVLEADLSDGATLKKVKIYNSDNSFSGESSNYTVNVDLTNKNISYSYNEVYQRIISDISAEVIDNKDASGRIAVYWNTVIPYFKPNIETTNSNIRRKTDNQTNLTDNKATITIKGSFYKVNDAIGNNNTITVKYKVWEDGKSEPTDYSTILTGITRNENNITVSYDIINIDYVKKYHYKLLLTDKYNYSSNEVTGDIPIGVALWTEYKDRVDFLSATIGDKPIQLGLEIAHLYLNNATLNHTAWDGATLPFGSSGTFYTTNNDYFTTSDNNYIKTKVAGRYLILFNMSANNGTNECDIFLVGNNSLSYRVDSYVSTSNGMRVLDLPANQTLSLRANTGITSLKIYHADILVIKI